MRLPHRAPGIAARLGLLAAAGSLLVGCSSNEIEEYTTDKAEFAAKPSPPAAADPHATPMAPEEPHWTLPEGWSEHPGSGLRFATLHVDEGPPPLELRVTPLGFAASDPLANVNRWAVQINAPSRTAEELDEVMQEIRVQGRLVRLFNLVGEPAHDGVAAQQILSAMLHGDQSVWFFMILGDHERVEAFEEPFEAFMRTVHFEQAAQEGTGAMAAADPHTGGGGAAGGDAARDGGQTPAGGAEGMAWVLPAQWTAQPGTSSMRVATIAVADAGEVAEVTVTKFPGDVGGMLPNINRWRQQLGMPAVDDLDDAALQAVSVAGTDAHFLDLRAGADAAAQRMYVVILPHEDMTWFLKMVGSNAFLQRQRASWDTFVDSVHFTGGTPGE